jgi:Glycosyltransferase Family 4
MRIAITADPEIPVPPVQYGGVERIVDELMQGLARRGHQVTLLAHPASTVKCDLRPYPGAASQSKIDTLRNMTHVSRAVLRMSRVFALSPGFEPDGSTLCNWSRRVLGGDAAEVVSEPEETNASRDAVNDPWRPSAYPTSQELTFGQPAPFRRTEPIGRPVRAGESR